MARSHRENWDVVNLAYQILTEKIEHVEHLTGYEGDVFASTGNAKEDILSITAVHPMRREAINALLKKAGVDWTAIRQLIDQGQIVETQYGDHTYYMRRFKQRQ